MDLAGAWYEWLNGLMALLGRSRNQKVEYNPYVAAFLNYQIEKAERERSSEWKR